MIQQEAALRGHLRTVDGAERLGEIVVGVEVGPHLRHVFLVFPFEGVAPLEPLRLLLVDDVGEVGVGHRVDDLRHLFGILAAHPHLNDFRLHRSRNLHVAHQVADRIFLFSQRRECRNTRATDGGGEHKRALDQLHLRLSVGLVFRIVAAATDTEHPRLVTNAKPRHGLVSAGQEQKGEQAGERAERERQRGCRQPTAAERMPHPPIVNAARERIGDSTIRPRGRRRPQGREHRIADRREHARPCTYGGSCRGR